VATSIPPGRTEALTSDRVSAVNVAVNENPAEGCPGLLSHMPADQYRYQACPLLHPESSD